jgi:hypothetical protein
VKNLNYPILEALPALHVTIIGIITAFFSVFSIYTYQKVKDAEEKLNDAKEKLDAVLKFSVNKATPNSIRFDGNNIYLNDVRKETLRQASMLYSFLDYEEKYGIPRSTHQREPNGDKVITACNELLSLLTDIFTSYPFWNNSFLPIQGQTDKASKVCAKELDSTRIQEMQRTVNYLCWTWSSNSHSLMTLAAKGMEFSHQKQMKEQTELFNKQKEIYEKQLGIMPESEKVRIWSRFHQPGVDRVTDYQEKFSSFFDKAHLIKKEVVPLLAESLSSFSTYNKTFRVRETTEGVIKLIVFNFFVGVMSPLVFLNMVVSVNFERVDFLFSAFEYLLLLTMLPYIWACYFLYKKVRDCEAFRIND